MLYGGNIVESWLVFSQTDVWDSLVRRQIDPIYTIGGNAIRLMGHPTAVLNGILTIQQYLDKWTQIIEYCDGADIEVYPCGYSGHLRGGKTLTELLSILIPWVEHLNRFSNLYGVDICNEPTINGGASVSGAAQPYEALKPLTPLPNGGLAIYQGHTGGMPISNFMAIGI